MTPDPFVEPRTVGDTVFKRFSRPRDEGSVVRAYLDEHRFLPTPDGDFPTPEEGEPCHGKGHRYVVSGVIPVASAAWRCTRKGCDAAISSSGGIPYPPSPWGFTMSTGFSLVSSHEPGMKERGAVVAWLRSGAEDAQREVRAMVLEIADAVERGEHVASRAD